MILHFLPIISKIYPYVYEELAGNTLVKVPIYLSSFLYYSNRYLYHHYHHHLHQLYFITTLSATCYTGNGSLNIADNSDIEPTRLD